MDGRIFVAALWFALVHPAPNWWTAVAERTTFETSLSMLTPDGRPPFPVEYRILFGRDPEE